MTTLQAPVPREYADLTCRLDAAGARFRLASCLRALAHFVLLAVPVAVAALFVAGSMGLAMPLKIGLLAAELEPPHLKPRRRCQAACSVSVGVWRNSRASSICAAVRARERVLQ